MSEGQAFAPLCFLSIYIHRKKNGMNLFDTIAAVSTPYGKGGVALIRISGADAIKIAESVFSPANKRPLTEQKSNMTVYGEIFKIYGDKKIQIDDGLATIFRAPRSFTGEDTVEICCHGGVLVTGNVLSAVLSAGARHAEAGEFTRRAFINGKMGLNEAEALGNLLEAETDEQMLASRAGMRGVLSVKTGEIYASLCSVLSSVFAHIDYPDEDLADMSEDEMLASLGENERRLQILLDTYSTGRAVMSGINTVILGKTNSGKSSLYNMLVGTDAAIVTDIEGTTRDVISEKIKLGRVMLKLSDTAGIRESSDVVEKIGIDRARAAAEGAELVLAVFDGSRALCDDERELVEYIKSLDAVKIAIINKSDRGCLDEYGALAGEFEYSINISALMGEGKDDLCELIEKIYIDKDLDTGNDAMIVNARQNAAITTALASVRTAMESVRLGLPLEICCADIEVAMQCLSELDGRAVSEDIVSEIFSKFCVGK